MNPSVNQEIGAALLSPAAVRQGEHTIALRPLSELPTPQIMDREYRERPNLESPASRGYVASISTWMNQERQVFLTIHGNNGARKQDFNLNVDEGTWYEDVSGGIDLTMTSGHTFYFYPSAVSS